MSDKAEAEYRQWWGAWIESYAREHGLQSFAITSAIEPHRQEVFAAGYAAAQADCEAKP